MRFYSRTDRALPTIRRMDQMGAEGRGGGGVLGGGRGGVGGGGGGVIISPYRTKITAACTFISSSRFRPSLTGLAVRAGEECVATAEMTRSLLVDLVFNDAAATSEP